MAVFTSASSANAGSSSHSATFKPLRAVGVALAGIGPLARIESSRRRSRAERAIGPTTFKSGSDAAPGFGGTCPRWDTSP